MNLKNKRGFVTLEIFIFIFTILIWIILLGIFGLISSLIDTNLDIDVEVGQVNLGNITQQTFGQINAGLIVNLDILGYIIIFGLILNMFVSAYLFRGKNPRLFIIIDIVLLVFAYILAVYVSNTYEILINSTSLLNIYINNMAKSSTFLLRLPTFVSIIGVVMMVLSYAGFPRDTEKEIIVGELN